MHRYFHLYQVDMTYHIVGLTVYWQWKQCLINTLFFHMPQTVLLYDFLRHVIDYVLMDLFYMYVASRATRKWRRVMLGSAILAWSRFEVRGFS